jgi:hypothetical protein
MRIELYLQYQMGLWQYFLFKLTNKKRKLLEKWIKIYLWGKICFNWRSRFTYLQKVNINPKIKEWLLVVKDALAKTFANIDYSLAPSYQYFDEKLILNTNTIKSSKIDLLSIFLMLFFHLLTTGWLLVWSYRYKYK